ncbi:MAG TPA: outer membrane lipoprotein carrier protein LolA [Archangium sp.]
MLLTLVVFSQLTVADAGTPAPAAKKADAGVVLAADAGVARTPLAPDVKALVDRVQSFYEKTQDFTADFKQDYTYKAFKRTQSSSGTVTFRKPALMRWEYEKPGKKTFVLAGDRVFAHDPEAKLVTRAALSTNQLSASVTFLFGVGKLENEFSIVKKACTTCTGTQLELTPLVVDPRFKKIYLEVDEKTAQVLKSTVIDPDGSENAISFINLKTNVGIDEKSFKIVPPPGTQVQDFLTNTQTTVPSPDAGK